MKDICDDCEKLCAIDYSDSDDLPEDEAAFAHLVYIQGHARSEGAIYRCPQTNQYFHYSYDYGEPGLSLGITDIVFKKIKEKSVSKLINWALPASINQIDL